MNDRDCPLGVLGFVGILVGLREFRRTDARLFLDL